VRESVNKELKRVLDGRREDFRDVLDDKLRVVSNEWVNAHWMTVSCHESFDNALVQQIDDSLVSVDYH